MIVLAQSLAAAKVRVPTMMFSSASLRSLQVQQGDHHVRTVVAIRHGDVAWGEAPQHRSQQGQLACLFAFVWGAIYRIPESPVVFGRKMLALCGELED
jgi:hypothetical protein